MLGISESAVNQRIEIVRARLGGLPRGELARLYRLNFSTDEASELPIWQKIHLPNHAQGSDGDGAGGIQAGIIGGSQKFGDAGVDGSQLSALLSADTPDWLSSNERPMAMARLVMIGAIVIAALALAILITKLLGPGGIADAL